ncbi:MAG: tetratricopeptide repeat protein [Planctomycetes bacterium]|nr:tetratricopeptide repeat protein [Planctomycetota bacterium]
MKRLNVKLIAVLVISTMVVSGVTYVIHGKQIGKNADGLRERGDEAKAAGKESLEAGQTAEARDHYEQAARHYERYLIYRGENDEHNVLVELASVYMDIAELPRHSSAEVVRAISTVEKTLSSHEEEHELRRRLVKYLMRYGRRRIRDAVEHSEKLVEFLPEDAEARIQLARCYYIQDELDKSIETLGVLVGFDVKQQKFGRPALAADMVSAYDLLANIVRRRRSKNIALADSIIDAMVSANDKNHEVYLYRAKYIERYADKEKDPDPRIKEDILKAQSLAATNANVLLAVAALKRKSDDAPEAIELLEEGKRRYPKDGRMYIQLAQVYLAMQKVNSASGEIDEGLKKVPKSRNMLRFRAQIQYQLKDIEGLRRTKGDLEKAGFTNVLTDYVDALANILEGKWFAASQSFERGRRFWTSSPAQLRAIDLKLADCYGHMGQPDLQLAKLRSLLSKGSDLRTLSGEIQALTNLGRSDQAREKLLEIKDKDEAVFYHNLYGTPSAIPSFWGRLLALEQVRQGRRLKPQQDWSLVDEISGNVRKRMNEVSAKAAKALAEAEKTLAEAEKDNMSPDEIASLRKQVAGLRKQIEYFSIAETRLTTGVLEAKGGSQAAGALLAKARKRFPDDYDLQRIEVGRIQRADGPAAALAKIDQLQAKFPRYEWDLKLSRITPIIRQNDKDTRARLAEIEADADRSPSLRHKQLFWSALARAYLALRDFDECRRLMQLVAKSDPDNPSHVMQQFEIARANGKEEWMQELVDDLKRRKIEGTGSSQLLYAQAALAVDRYQKSDKKDAALLDHARDLLNQARIVRKDWHKISQLVGEIDHIQGDFKAAIEGYQLALKQGPADLNTVNRLVGLLSSQLRYDEALQTLDLLGDTRRNKTVQRAKAGIYTLQGRMTEALKAAALAVSENSENSADHRWYGKILAKANKLAEAEAAFRRAVEQGSNLPDPWYDLVSIQVANKQRAKAEQTIREARLRLPEELSLRFVAKCHRLLGNPQLELQAHRENLLRNPGSLAAMRGVAQFHYDRYKSASRSLRRSNDVKTRERATAYILQGRKMTKSILYKMILAETPDSRIDRLSQIWARQQLATLLADSGSYQDSNHGLKILGGNSVDGKLSAPDRLLKARLLARRPEPSARGKAIEIYEKLSVQNSHFLNDQDKVTMAQLYERAGKWTICRQTMNKLIAERPNEVGYLVQYIQMLLRNGEAQQAGPQLVKLSKMSASRAIILQLQALTLAKLNRGEEAVRTILAEVKRARPLDDKSYSILANAAKLMVDLEQYAEAEKLYREYVKAVPGNMLGLARFLAIHGTTARQVDEAFVICDRVLASGEANEQRRSRTERAINQIGLRALSENSQIVNQSHRVKVLSWIQRAARRAPDSHEVQGQLALYYDTLGEYQKSADVYEQLLETPVANFVGTVAEATILNNLAYVLADKLGKAEGGLERINRAISILGPQGDLLDTRAIVYLRLDQPNDAVDDLKLALRDYVPGRMRMKYLHLAMAFQAAERGIDAEDALRKAIGDGLKPSDLTERQRKDYDQLRRQLNINDGEAE